MAKQNKKEQPKISSNNTPVKVITVNRQAYHDYYIERTIEAGIGLTAALHLAAASPAVTLECGLATLHLLVDDLLVNNLPVHDGLLTVPTGPGLGIELDWEALRRYEL